jgi:hypothetical protein
LAFSRQPLQGLAIEANEKAHRVEWNGKSCTECRLEAAQDKILQKRAKER